MREATPEHTSATVNLAQLLSIQGEHAAALKLLDKAARALSERAHGGGALAARVRLLRLRARTLYDAGRLPEARRAIGAAVHLHPSSAVGWHQLTQVLYRAALPPVGSGAARGARRSSADAERAAASLELALRVGAAVAHADGADAGEEGSKRLETVHPSLLDKCKALIRETPFPHMSHPFPPYVRN